MKAQAIKYYNEGNECAKCILLAAADFHKEITDEVLSTAGAISNGFGAGLLCGCLVSGLMVLSAVLGEDEAKAKRMILMTEFKDQFGNINCSHICKRCCNCENVIGFVCDWLMDQGL